MHACAGRRVWHVGGLGVCLVDPARAHGRLRVRAFRVGIIVPLGSSFVLGPGTSLVSSIAPSGSEQNLKHGVYFKVRLITLLFWRAYVGRGVSS